MAKLDFILYVLLPCLPGVSEGLLCGREVHHRKAKGVAIEGGSVRQGQKQGGGLIRCKRRYTLQNVNIAC